MGNSDIDRLARALGLGSGSGRAAADKSSSRPFKKKDVPSLAQYIQSDTCKKIYLMVCLILNLAMCGSLSLISVRKLGAGAGSQETLACNGFMNDCRQASVLLREFQTSVLQRQARLFSYSR